MNGPWLWEKLQPTWQKTGSGRAPTVLDRFGLHHRVTLVLNVLTAHSPREQGHTCQQHQGLTPAALGRGREKTSNRLRIHPCSEPALWLTQICSRGTNHTPDMRVHTCTHTCVHTHAHTNHHFKDPRFSSARMSQRFHTARERIYLIWHYVFNRTPPNTILMYDRILTSLVLSLWT